MLALKTGIQQSRLSLIENELVKPREAEMKKIAKVLGVQIHDIFSSKEQNNEN
jgi:DNA-binding XRE family transcriptional regulator